MSYFCKKCGTRVEMGDHFCSKCGDQLNWKKKPAPDDEDRAAAIAAMRSENVPEGRYYYDQLDEDDNLVGEDTTPSARVLSIRGIAIVIVLASIVIIVATLFGKAADMEKDYEKNHEDPSVQNEVLEDKKPAPGETSSNEPVYPYDLDDSPMIPAEPEAPTNDDIYVDVPFEIDPNDPYSAILTKKYQELISFEFDDFLDITFVKAQCEKNAMAFAKEYGGRRIAVAGILDSMSVAFDNNNLTIKCQDSEWDDLFSVICTLSNDVDQPYLSDVEVDYYITVVGVIDTEFMSNGTLYLKDCAIYDFETSEGDYICE